MPSPQTILKILFTLIVVGCLSLSAYPLLPLHPWIRSATTILGLQLVAIPSMALIVFGRKLGLWTGDSHQKADQHDIAITKNAILGFTSFGLLALCLFAFSSVSPFSWSNSIRVAGIGFLYSAAFFASGSLLGFLFGIPRSINSNAKKKDRQGTAGDIDTADNRGPLYSANTNLEEISDWLTKIIVGLGLINLKSAPAQLKKAAWFFSNFCGDDYCESVALALIIYFSICGFFLGYLMTRLFLTGAFTRADQAATGGIVDSWGSGLPPGLSVKVEDSISKTRPSRTTSGQVMVDLGPFAE